MEPEGSRTIFLFCCSPVWPTDTQAPLPPPSRFPPTSHSAFAPGLCPSSASTPSMVSVREDRKASATSAGVSYMKESGRGQRAGQMSGRGCSTGTRRGMVGFQGGKGSAVSSTGRFGRERDNALARGLEAERARPDLRAPWVKGHLGKKALFRSKSHLPGRFAAGSRAR